MQFFKNMLSSCMGTLVALFVGSMFLTGMVASIFVALTKFAMEEQKGPPLEPLTVINVELNSGLVEHPSLDPFDRFDFNRLDFNESLGLDAFLMVIHRAKRDEKVAGIVLDLKGLPKSWAQSSDVRRALLSFKEAGKWILAHSNTYSFKEYHLASVADEISMTPKGDIDLKGLGMEMIFMGKLMKKLGIDIKVFRGENNSYKSAVEPFVMEGMSRDNRAQMKEFVDEMWLTLSRDIETSRGLEAGTLSRLVESYAPSSAEEALSLGLIDHIEYSSQWKLRIKNKLGLEDDAELEMRSPLSYAKVKDIVPLKENVDLTEKGITVLLAEGAIVSDERDDGKSITPGYMKSWLDELINDENVSALVLRLNSPGGEALAAEQIWFELNEFKKKKPLVISMGDTVASGGYYMACAGHYIFSEETTLTGSIGVFGIMPQVDQFLENELHLNVDSVHSHEKVSGSGLLKPLSSGRIDDIEKDVNLVYETFLQRVSEGRGMPISEVDHVSRGRLWTGKKALEVGLVDKIGGLSDAIEYARKKAALPLWAPIAYSHGGDELQRWIKDLQDKGAIKSAHQIGARYFQNKLFGSSFETHHELKQFIHQIQDYSSLFSGPQMRLPFLILKE